MSQSTIAEPSITVPTTRHVSALVVAVIALLATLAIAAIVFAWTVAGESEPVPPTLPALEVDQTPAVPSTDSERMPANGVPVLNDNCNPRQACAF
jgi:hypothetical protein